LLLHLGQRVREAPYVGGLGLEDVEGYPLRALGTDARQPAEFVDEVLNHAFVHGTLPSPGGPGRRTSHVPLCGCARRLLSPPRPRCGLLLRAAAYSLS